MLNLLKLFQKTVIKDVKNMYLYTNTKIVYE